MDCRQNIILSLDRELAGFKPLDCERGVLSCVVVSGVLARLAHVEGNDIPLPAAGGVTVGSPGSWFTIPHQDVADTTSSTKLFLCHAPEVTSQLGIATSINWRRPIWGTQCPALPGVWLVVARLPARRIDLKLVNRDDDLSLHWEPPAYRNKQLILGTQPEIIQTSWAHTTVNTPVEVPHYRRLATFYVSVPWQVHESLAASNSRLVITGLRDSHNKHWLDTASYIAMSWSEYHQVYTHSMTLPGHMTEMRYSLAIVDQTGSITHVDEYSYNQTDVTHRVLYPGLNTDQTVHCHSFVDICPSKKGSANSLDLGRSATSIHDLINTPRPAPCDERGEYRRELSPGHLSLYRGMIIGYTPSSSRHRAASTPRPPPVAAVKAMPAAPDVETTTTSGVQTSHISSNFMDTPARGPKTDDDGIQSTGQNPESPKTIREKDIQNPVRSPKSPNTTSKNIQAVRSPKSPETPDDDIQTSESLNTTGNSEIQTPVRSSKSVDKDMYRNTPEGFATPYTEKTNEDVQLLPPVSDLRQAATGNVSARGSISGTTISLSDSLESTPSARLQMIIRNLRDSAVSPTGVSSGESVSGTSISTPRSTGVSPASTLERLRQKRKSNRTGISATESISGTTVDTTSSTTASSGDVSAAVKCASDCGLITPPIEDVLHHLTIGCERFYDGYAEGDQSRPTSPVVPKHEEDARSTASSTNLKEAATTLVPPKKPKRRLSLKRLKAGSWRRKSEASPPRVDDGDVRL